MIKPDKILTILIFFIVLGSAAAAGIGLWAPGAVDGPEVTSTRGETVRLDGRGIYKNDSVSYAAQARGQDLATLAVGLPLLLAGLLLSRKKSLRGGLLAAGTLGYFLYTYSSYSYLSAYNELFLLYVALFSASLFGFILAFRNLSGAELEGSLSPRFPRRFLGIYQIVLGALLLLMWLGRILPPLAAGLPPIGLETYTTLVIQANDLGIIVPAAILSGILLLKRHPMGTVLSGVLLMKFFTMGIALDAMMIIMTREGVVLNGAEVVIFVILTLMGIVSSGLMLGSVKPGKRE